MECITKKTKEIIIEAIIIGVIIGGLMVIALNIFIKHECKCYDEYGNIYSTTWFKFKANSCNEQCAYFGEKEGLELTDVEPRNVESKYPSMNYNLSWR